MAETEDILNKITKLSSANLVDINVSKQRAVELKTFVKTNKDFLKTIIKVRSKTMEDWAKNLKRYRKFL